MGMKKRLRRSRTKGAEWSARAASEEFTVTPQPAEVRRPDDANTPEPWASWTTTVRYVIVQLAQAIVPVLLLVLAHVLR